MKTSEVLTLAKEKINSPEKWTKDNIAVDINKLPVAYYNPNAVCWCAVGAILSVTSTDDESTSAQYLLEGLIAQYFLEGLIAPYYNLLADYNDDKHTEYTDVIKLFDIGIDLAKEIEGHDPNS